VAVLSRPQIWLRRLQVHSLNNLWPFQFN
jgi:hypothetical protein